MVKNYLLIILTALILSCSTSLFVERHRIKALPPIPRTDEDRKKPVPDQQPDKKTVPAERRKTDQKEIDKVVLNSKNTTVIVETDADVEFSDSDTRSSTEIKEILDMVIDMTVLYGLMVACVSFLLVAKTVEIIMRIQQSRHKVESEIIASTRDGKNSVQSLRVEIEELVELLKNQNDKLEELHKVHLGPQAFDTNGMPRWYASNNENALSQKMDNMLEVAKRISLKMNA